MKEEAQRSLVHSLAQFETFFYVVGENSSLNGTLEFMTLNPELHSNMELELQYWGLLDANNFVFFATRQFRYRTLSITLISYVHPTAFPSIFQTKTLVVTCN